MTNTTHSFSVAVAQQVGLREAIFLNHFGFWHTQNRANDRNFFDGHFWTYNTVKAFNEQYPYLTAKEIWGVLERLEKSELVRTGNYNEKKMDRTKWYALTEKGCLLLSVPFSPQVKCKLPAGKMHLPVWEIPFSPRVRAIPVTNTFTNQLTFSYWKKNGWTKPIGVSKGFRLPPTVSPQFAEAWNNLIQSPKWRKKGDRALTMAFSKLSAFHERYAIGLMENAVMNDYQGVVFTSTESDYRKWLNQQQPQNNTGPNGLGLPFTPTVAPKPQQPSGAVR